MTRRDLILGSLAAGTALRGATTMAATVTVTTKVLGAVGPGFAGLSYEKGQMANPFFSAQNANAIGLFKLIGPSLLRIGGNSVDKTTWTSNGKGRASGQVAPSDIDALAGFLKATGWQVLYGVNLAQSTPALAAAEVAYAVQSLGPYLYGIEIGNEVDLYHSNGYFPSTWGFSDYLALWQSFVTGIRQLSPNVPLTGPVAASNVSGYVAPFAKAEGKGVTLLSDHYYRGNGQAASSTADLLVSPDPSIVTQAKAMIAVSQSVDVPYRFAETNSFYNGGAPNVSDSYASALWVIDHLFACALNGAQGINLHGGGDSTGYTPIADSAGVVVGARPEFYGVTLFMLAGPGTLQQTTISAGGLNATAYAIQAVNGALSIIINNKDQAQTLSVTLQLPQSAPSATLMQMTGPALDATTGILIQGSAIQTDGTFRPGPAALLSTSPFSVSPLTTVLVQVPPPATPPLTISGVLAPASIGTAYGSGLNSVISMNDSAGVSQPVTPLYVSSSQVNFVIPSTVSLGAGTITINGQTAFLEIAAVAPSLYTLNTSNLAAAYVIRVTGTVQTVYPVSVPIDVSSGQVYLILFGTGIRGGGSNVSVAIGGVSAPVEYSGPQGVTPGLDQVNVLIPAQLAGSGTVNVVLKAGTISANVVNIPIL
jgi:uncharacterized protein (TIGR03437 family)